MPSLSRCFSVTLLCASLAVGQSAKPVLFTGLGDTHRAVTTKNAEAQKFFDQGLRLIYAFNHEEAGRSFARAAELDPKCAMAYWGVALAVGPNINDPEMDADRLKRAVDALKKALAATAGVTPAERDYIAALDKRYSPNPKADFRKLAVSYKQAMGELVARYPNDLDAATLFAESAMDLRPWKLWSPDGKASEGTEEIVRTLESVLRRDPRHLGANHYYIHAVEASGHPEKALASAERIKTLAPSAGHLVHMPAHAYIHTGDYHGASVANEIAIAADRAYLKANGAGGMYGMMYYPHNLHFLAVSAAMEGRLGVSRKAAAELVSEVTPHVSMMPTMLEGFLPTTIEVLVRFRQWDELMRLPVPDAKLHALTALWHFGRGMAFGAGSKRAEAERERASMEAAIRLVAKETLFGLNAAGAVLQIPFLMLDSRIAELRGDRAAALRLLREAARLEDGLDYDEPPGWYIPVRESLGRVMLQQGDAAGAEKVFREELVRHPNNGRGLFGLAECLRKQGRGGEASEAEKKFQAAWKYADVRVRLEDL